VGIALVFMTPHPSPILAATTAGLTILASSFLLLWACEAGQADVSQALALAAIALITVLPEYAVDMYFTWQAGQYPESEYAHYAIANMTGANRLIIGVGWAAIAILFWLKYRKTVALEGHRNLEIRFLGAASLYALVIPMKGSLVWYDGVILIGIFIWYLILSAKREVEEPEVEGPAAYLVALPKVKRRLALGALLLLAAGAILANAERFSEGLVGTGTQLGIDEFLLVQWLAPLASEAPEFLLAIMFTLQGKPSLGLGSMLSAKLNQWTLLVGMIPAVYGISSGSLASPIPLESFQHQEILLTAAQSVLAVVLVAGGSLSVGQGALLLGLFVAQFLAPAALDKLAGIYELGPAGAHTRLLLSLIYLVTAIGFVLDRPARLAAIFTRDEVAQAGAAEITDPAESEVLEGEDR
jgi:cation:H+ antiporter